MSVWTVDDLDDLARDYPADAHADVAALIAGARAVVALHRAVGRPDDLHCHCQTAYDTYPCATARALSLEESP